MESTELFVGRDHRATADPVSADPLVGLFRYIDPVVVVFAITSWQGNN
jgi:hypothetical protein